MSTKHTPGPWTHTIGGEGNKPDEGYSLTGNGVTIIGGCGCCGSPFVGNLADLPLIDAAPDLLAALQEALPFLHWAANRRGDAYPVIGNALEAIAKALDRLDN